MTQENPAMTADHFFECHLICICGRNIIFNNRKMDRSSLSSKHTMSFTLFLMITHNTTYRC